MIASQSNEDEILADIFGAIGEGNKRFVEFGCGYGNQNNTIALILRGWSGLWLEPRKKRVLAARRLWGANVKVMRKIVTAKNVNHYVKDPLDFLSIDIDGNDYAVWEAVTARPRVVCIEYDPINGSSLHAMRALGVDKGYQFWGCSSSNVNAFFLDQ